MNGIISTHIPIVEDHMHVGEGFVAVVEISDRHPWGVGAASECWRDELNVTLATHSFGVKMIFIVTV